MTAPHVQRGRRKLLAGVMNTLYSMQTGQGTDVAPSTPTAHGGKVQETHNVRARGLLQGEAAKKGAVIVRVQMHCLVVVDGIIEGF
jgi:hypothetical protein